MAIYRYRPNKNQEPQGTARGVKHLIDFSDYDKHIIGQSHIKPLLDSIATNVALRNSPLWDGRPVVGAYMLPGPTGVGKTETVEYVAAKLHGKSSHYLRVDCSEYQHSHEVAKVVGAPPGYLGHRETQPLLTQTRINSLLSETSSIAIILFDEFEKAHESLYRILLGVLDKGRLRLGDNSTTNFDYCLLFFTTNLGAVRSKADFGITQTQVSKENPYIAAARQNFSREFLNRLTEICPFNSLTRENCLEITKMHVNRGLSAFDKALIKIQVQPKVYKQLAEMGFSEVYGAREVIRTIRRKLLEPLHQRYFSGNLVTGLTYRVSSVEPFNISELKTQVLDDPIGF